jgi:hypothetical protein
LLPVSSTILEDIIGGFRVHLSLPFRLFSQVVRLWLFDGATLRYMACPEQGVHAEDGSWHYHLSQVYELNNPTDKEEMQDDGWIDGSIGRYVYIPPAVVSRLLFNLKHAVFDDSQAPPPPSREESRTPSVSLSQQVEAQIQSEITNSTQFPTSDGVVVPSTPEEDDEEAEDEIRDDVPLSPIPSQHWHLPPPPLPQSVHNRDGTLQSAVHPSQATTASQASTIDRSNEHSLAIPESSSVSYLDYGESCVDVNIDQATAPSTRTTTTPPLHANREAAQGLLSRNHLLSDSLIRDDIEDPPEIWDTDDEERDE